MFRTGAQFMMLVLLAGLAFLREARHEPLASWDNAFADFLAMHSRHGAKPAPVVLVEIDQSYLSSHPWPWNPLDFSLFFQAALPVKPGVVAVDQVLNWERAMILPDDQVRKLPQYEKMLRDNILRTPKMLLGATLGVPEDPQVIPPLQEVPLLRQVQGRLEAIPEFTAIEQQPTESFRMSSSVGFTNLPATRARYNSVPMVFRYRGQVTPSFTLQAVMLWAQITPDDVLVELGSHISLGNLWIPIDEAGRMRVDFGSPKVAMGIGELILASEQKEAGRETVAPIDKLQGSIVLLSRTDNEARTIPLAARRDGSPGELFASGVATIVNQSFIRPAPDWAQYTVIGAFMVLFGYWVPRWKKFQAVLMGIVALTVYSMAALAIFGNWLVWLPGVLPAGVVAVCLLFRIVTPDAFGRPKKPVIL